MLRTCPEHEEINGRKKGGKSGESENQLPGRDGEGNDGERCPANNAFTRPIGAMTDIAVAPGNQADTAQCGGIDSV